MSLTTSTFDLERFAQAAEERDAATQASMYGPEAVVTIVDRHSPPSSPRVLQGRGEITAWLEDMYGRDMTHKIGSTVSDATGAAYTQACRYADGTQVFCSTVIELADGAIARQSVVHVWDES